MTRIVLRHISMDVRDVYSKQFQAKPQHDHYEPAPPWLVNLLDPTLVSWLNSQSIPIFYARIWDALRDEVHVRLIADVPPSYASYYYLRWGDLAKTRSQPLGDYP